MFIADRQALGKGLCFCTCLDQLAFETAAFAGHKESPHDLVTHLQSLFYCIDHDRNCLAIETAQVEENLARTLCVMQRGEQVGLAENAGSWCQ